MVYILQVTILQRDSDHNHDLFLCHSFDQLQAKDHEFLDEKLYDHDQIGFYSMYAMQVWSKKVSSKFGVYEI
jgi:hypothetical protein